MNFFYCIVCVRGKPDIFWLDVNNNKDGVCEVAFEEFVDFQIWSTKLWARMVPTYQFLFSCQLENALRPSFYTALPTQYSLGYTIYFLEHDIHGFMVIVIQKPNWRIFLIFFKRNWKIRVRKYEHKSFGHGQCRLDLDVQAKFQGLACWYFWLLDCSDLLHSEAPKDGLLPHSTWPFLLLALGACEMDFLNSTFATFIDQLDAALLSVNKQKQLQSSLCIPCSLS